MKLFVPILIFFIVVLCSCKKSNGEANSDTLTASSGCSDTITISYSRHIKPIIDNNCISCHFKGSSLDLTDFNTVNALTVEGSLTGSITGQTEFRSMPPKGKLDTCSIRKILIWSKQGCKNN